jgi:stage II sporulation protein AA (anti-sigma F factor antagonist)
VNQPPKLRIRQAGNVAILDIEGDLTDGCEEPLLLALHDPHVASRSLVLLNFSRVGYINSAGISVMVSLILESREKHRQLMACSLSSHYQKIFRMVGLSSFLPVYENEGAALVVTGER